MQYEAEHHGNYACDMKLRFTLLLFGGLSISGLQHFDYPDMPILTHSETHSF